MLGLEHEYEHGSEDEKESEDVYEGTWRFGGTPW